MVLYKKSNLLLRVLICGLSAKSVFPSQLSIGIQKRIKIAETGFVTSQNVKHFQIQLELSKVHDHDK
jgi:hypothetical protein